MSDNTSKSEARFILDLDKSRAPAAFRDKQNLWEEDIKRIYRLVGSQVQILKKHKREEKKEYREPAAEALPHTSVAIFGPSGSGKSSLLRTLADDVGRKHGSIWKKANLDERSIYSLPVMDPTTWMETEQFLYAFLASALEAEKQHQEEKDRGFPQGLSPVQLAFQDVNEYLRIVDDPGKPEDYDPLGLSLQKLERHTSGLRLAKAIGKFIENLTAEFGVEVVLLPVDDLDMAPNHLLTSLQAYQSFLLHPQLIPVFTFTDRMPEELIEAHYEKRVVAEGARRRLENTPERLGISEQLAVQFLARCFPVRNRVRLGPAPGRVQRAFFDIRPNEGESVTDKIKVLELLMSSSFLLFGHPDKEDSHKVRAALRPSTLRRQFQVVDAMADCGAHTLRSPQLARMAHPEIAPGDLAKIAGVPNSWETWYEERADHYLGTWWKPPISLAELRMSPEKSPQHYEYFIKIARNLDRSLFRSSWATIFNGATWSLLNVHRDTLRELGLFLEDLYSWSPKELRSVVLNKILAQDRTVRRTVVDRWYNRTDYRRSQILSLLAANIFRPWMTGEEPYGDEELAIQEQLKIEAKRLKLDEGAEERKKHRSGSDDFEAEMLERVSFPAPQGMLWFLNLVLGFYLPQILTRNWAKAFSSEEPVMARMSGNGWDLYHAPINAVRIAAARQEISSFGMLFVDPRGYRHALKAITPGRDIEKESLGSGLWKGNDSSDKAYLLLRIWSCHGYSNSRYWAAFSLWRGLGFIGQVLKLGLDRRDDLETFFMELQKKDKPHLESDELYDTDLYKELTRLIRSHCLAGLVPGSFLDRDSDEERLRHGFPRWEPMDPQIEKDISKLAISLIDWLRKCWHDRIFPMPAGEVWIDWRDCFIRRVHGEYILGGLWPRLRATYLEEHPRREDCQKLAHRRTVSEDKLSHLETPEEKIKHLDAYVESPAAKKHMDRFKWTAALAAATWSDVVLEYWRGCPAILYLLITCPVFYKSRERFGLIQHKKNDSGKRKKQASAMKEVIEKLIEFYKLDEEIKIAKKKNKLDTNELKNLKSNQDAKKKFDIDKEPKWTDDQKFRFKWLQRLSLPLAMWEQLKAGVLSEGILLVSDELCIERVRVEDFDSTPAQRHALTIERTEFTVGAKEDGEPPIVAESKAEEYPDTTKFKS